MSKRINLTLSEREYQFIEEVKYRFYKNMRIATIVKSLCLDYAELLMQSPEDQNKKFKQLNLLTGK